MGKWSNLTNIFQIGWNNIGQFSLMFTLSHTVGVNHELRPFAGLYHRIGTLNGKPLWKSQENPSPDNPFSPLQTAYVWYSKESEHFMLSKHCFDEDCGEEPFWACLDVNMLMPSDLFGWVAYPCWIFGYFWRCHLTRVASKKYCQALNANLTSQINSHNQLHELTTELLAAKEECEAMKKTLHQLELEKEVDDGTPMVPVVPVEPVAVPASSAGSACSDDSAMWGGNQYTSCACE